MTKKGLVFLFPGQGSQAVGMLNGFEGNAVVASALAEASRAAVMIVSISPFFVVMSIFAWPRTLEASVTAEDSSAIFF